MIISFNESDLKQIICKYYCATGNDQVNPKDIKVSVCTGNDLSVDVKCKRNLKGIDFKMNDELNTSDVLGILNYFLGENYELGEYEIQKACSGYGSGYWDEMDANEFNGLIVTVKNKELKGQARVRRNKNENNR